MENLAGEVERDAAGFRRQQAPALRHQQRHAQGAFEQADLGADGLHRHAESLGRPREAALLGGDPEIVKVPIVQFGFHVSYFTKFKLGKLRFY